MCIFGSACGEGRFREAPEVTRRSRISAKETMRIFAHPLLSQLVMVGAFAQAPTATPTPDATKGLTISHAGVRPVVDGSPKFFTGSAKVEQLFPANAPSRVSGGLVTLTPDGRGAR